VILYKQHFNIFLHYVYSLYEFLFLFKWIRKSRIKASIKQKIVIETKFHILLTWSPQLVALVDTTLLWNAIWTQLTNFEFLTDKLRDNSTWLTAASLCGTILCTFQACGCLSLGIPMYIFADLHFGHKFS